MEDKNNDLQKQLILKKLKDSGCRITNQRKIIIDIIMHNQITCIKEIYYKATAQDSAIGVSTVYRMMNLLEDIGAIDRKNLYRIACDEECHYEESCTVYFKNKSRLNLSANEWNMVIQEGLKAKGLLKNREIDTIVMSDYGLTEQKKMIS